MAAPSTLVDLVKLTVLSNGSGAFTLGAAINGFRGTEALLDGGVYSYSVQQDSQYELGRGTWLAASSQLVRAPFYSSNGGGVVNFGPNAAVAMTFLAEDIIAAVAPPSANTDALVKEVARATSVEATLAASVARIASGLKSYATLAALNADTSQPIGMLAYVYADPTTANDTVYVFQAGVWSVATGFYAGLASVVQPLVTQAQAAATAAEAAGAELQPLTSVVDITSDSTYSAVERDSAGNIAVATHPDGTKEIGSLIVYDLVVLDSVTLPGGGSGNQVDTYLPADPRLTLDGFAQAYKRTGFGFIPSRPFTSDGGPGASMQYDGPCVRCAFVTTATDVAFDVVFHPTVNGQSDTTSPAPYVAAVLIGGALQTTASTSATGDDPQTIALSGLAAGTKLIELIWPYGRPMELSQVRVTRGAGVVAAGTPARRMVGQIDSITHGRTQSTPDKGWFFGVTRDAGYEPIDLGYSGRQLSQGDGTLAGSIAGMRVTTCMSGANESQNGQYSPTVFAQKVTAYLDEWFAAAAADAHVAMISQIWNAGDGSNPASGNKNSLGFTAQDYRTAFENAVTAYKNANASRSSRITLVQGLTLVTNSADRFVDGLHPNDTGAAELRANLSPIVKAL